MQKYGKRMLQLALNDPITLELLDESWSKSKTESKDFPALVQLRGCICFGLGSLRDSPKSQLQLALLQELLGLLEVRLSSLIPLHY